MRLHHHAHALLRAKEAQHAHIIRQQLIAQLFEHQHAAASQHRPCLKHSPKFQSLRRPSFFRASTLRPPHLPCPKGCEHTWPTSPHRGTLYEPLASRLCMPYGTAPDFKSAVRGLSSLTRTSGGAPSRRAAAAAWSGTRRTGTPKLHATKRALRACRAQRVAASGAQHSCKAAHLSQFPASTTCRPSARGTSRPSLARHGACTEFCGKG